MRKLTVLSLTLALVLPLGASTVLADMWSPNNTFIPDTT
jgi:hypothetical protein